MIRGKIYPYNFKIERNLGVEIKLPTIISFERYDMDKRFNDYMMMNPQIQSIIKNSNSIDNIKTKLNKTVLETLKNLVNTTDKHSMVEYYTDQFTSENILKQLDRYKKDDKND